jgi:pimeloyl-ACP methyl ester carboxylesterase
MLRGLERIIISAVTITGLVYLLFGVYLYANQSRLLYYPGHSPGRDDLNTEIFQIDNERIRVHTLNPGLPSAVLYFGGNGESVGYSAEEYARALPGRTVYLVNYRGYGGSTGQPEEQALYRDAAYIYDQLSPRHVAISVIGRSLGSGVATWLAVERPVERLVLITPFDSISKVAESVFPLYPVSFLLTEKYASAERAHRINARTLMLVAGDDQIVRRERTRKLENAFDKNLVETVVFPTANHNSISLHPVFYKTIGGFLGATEGG